MPLTAEDKHEILELTARFNVAMDHRAAEEVADLFTEDGQLWAGTQLRAEGRAGFQALLQTLSKVAANVLHFTSNAIIDGDGDQARLRIYFMAWDTAGGNMVPFAAGSYDDTVAKVNGRWKFKVRRATIRAGKIPPLQNK